MSDITGVNHLTLVVADLPRALAFWRDRLGAVVRAEGARSVYLELGALWLCLEKGAPTPRHDDTHIAFSVSEEGLARLSESLSEVPRWKENRSEGRSLYLLDPDGHRIELHVGDLASRLAHYAARPEAGMRIV